MDHLGQGNIWNRLSRAVYALLCGLTGVQKPVVSGLKTEPGATKEGLTVTSLSYTQDRQSQTQQ